MPKLTKEEERLVGLWALGIDDRPEHWYSYYPRVLFKYFLLFLFVVAIFTG